MRKIALFIGQLYSEYQIEVTKAIEAEAKSRGYLLDVFVNFGVYGNNFLYAEGEKSIIKIPHLEEYVGVILATDTFELPGFDDEIIRYIKKNYSIPIVSLRVERKECYSVIIDDVLSMEMMVEHFITVHRFKNICFMTGKMSMTDAQRRLTGYKNVMSRYKIPIQEHMIYEGNYWRDHGMAAVKWFLDQKEKPQAIVCSNDFMAISVCDALRSLNIRVPEDIAVSGFDDLEEAQFYLPSITSMRVPSDLMGKRAVEILDDLSAGKKMKKLQLIPVHQSLRGSCGCKNQMDLDLVQNLLAQKVKLEGTMAQLAYMSVAFDNADTLDGLMQTANFYARNLYFNRLYVCFNDQEELDQMEIDDKPPYSENMILKAIVGGSNAITVNEYFDRKQILPEQYREEGQTLYIFAFHDRVDHFGYVAVSIDELDNIQQMIQIWLLSLADALGKLKMYSASHELVEMREKYEIDALTGIGNRRKMERVVRNKHERLTSMGERFAMLSVDMDDLKTINDTYGHPEGDQALTKIATILNEECEGEGAAFRVGGDEYIVCLEFGEVCAVDEYVARVRARVAEDNATGEHAYTLSVSIGYAIAQKGTPLMESIKLADDRMYAEKRGKKSRRRALDEK